MTVRPIPRAYLMLLSIPVRQYDGQLPHLSTDKVKMCMSAPNSMSRQGDMWRRIHGRITKRPTNFSWILDGKLAGSGRPMSRNEFDWIISQGVKCIVTMTMNELPPRWIPPGIQYMHVPTPDMTAPNHERLDATADFIASQIDKGHPVAVHCAAGLGRAGTVLACYLIKHEGYTAERAIREIRGKRPGSIQSAEQETAVGFFAKQL